MYICTCTHVHITCIHIHVNYIIMVYTCTCEYKLYVYVHEHVVYMHVYQYNYYDNIMINTTTMTNLPTMNISDNKVPHKLLLESIIGQQSCVLLYIYMQYVHVHCVCWMARIVHVCNTTLVRMLFGTLSLLSFYFFVIFFILVTIDSAV